ncbi:MAG TPA: PLP-dependent aminotransferase family protein, partial [Armatimonadota bacterium]
MTKYEQIMRHIQELIHTGSLRDGERIPSIRAMAGQMRVSLMTVMEAYRRLEDQGVVESRPQSGYYLRPSALRGVSPVRLPEARTEIIPMHTSAVHVPEIIERLIEQAQRHDVVPLGAGLPAAEFFPSAELGTRLARVARSSPDAMNRYCMGCGSAALICEITRWMASSGCTPLANDVVVTGGATQGLLFALRAVTRPGDTVAVESPGYFGFYALLQFLHLNAVEIPADPQTGFSVDALADVMRSGTRPACILLSANHSNPTGAVMPDDARAALVALSMRHAIPIIEDDTYGALSFDQRYPRPLKSFAPHYVLYVGSMSKILAPGYRMGWVAGGRHHEDVLRCHNMTVVSAPVATQLAVASFLHDGGM